MKLFRETTKDHVIVRDGVVLPDSHPRYAPEGRDVKWRSNGSGVVYEMAKGLSRRAYEKLEINRVAREMSDGKACGGSMVVSAADVAMSRAMRRARQRAGL